MLRAWSDVVGVKQGFDTASYSGLMACGSRLCPVCGPRLANRNKQEIQQAVSAWRAEGGRVLFGTATVRHTLGDRFELLKFGVSQGWERVTQGKGWVADRRRHGVEHWIRVFEEKWSPLSGWHLHIHYLLFVASPEDRPDALPVEDLLRSIYRRWNAGVQAAGLSATVFDAQELHELQGDGAEVMGEYFTKQAMGTEERTAEQIALELTNRDGKTRDSIGVPSLTPGEILTLAASGQSPVCEKLWAEYEQGMIKRRVIAFSKGLRARTGIGDELSDVDAAQLEPAELVTVVMEMRRQMFKRVAAKRGMRTELLARVLRDGPEATVGWLSERGIDAVVGRLDNQGEQADVQPNSQSEPHPHREGADALSVLSLPY